MAFLLNTVEGFCVFCLLLTFCYLLRVESHVIRLREAPPILEQFPDFPLEFGGRFQTEPRSGQQEPAPEMENTTMTLASEEKSANNTALSIEDFAVSVLFKFKYYPFRKRKVQQGSRTIGGSEMSAAKRLVGNKGVMATGIDFGLPGGLGVGYGEQTPFRNFFSFNRISFAVNEG